MTLEEAIKHAEKVAEEQEKAAKEWHENQVRKCELFLFAEMDYTHENECKKCAKEHRQLAEWLKDYKRLLEQLPCDDCISRQEAISAIQDKYYYHAVGIDIVDIVAHLPSVTPKAESEDRPAGRWIDIQYFKNDDTYYRPKCPFCSIEPKEYSNFCPNCGARMEAETRIEQGLNFADQDTMMSAT